jgi:hypothetical protein
LRTTTTTPSTRGRFLPLTLAGLLVTMLTVREAAAQTWTGYGNDPQHSCMSSTASQRPEAVRWAVNVDDAPPFNGNDLFIHYASPVITRKNSVIVTTRTASGGFYLRSFSGANGTPLWTQNLTTNYILPPHNWIPSCGSTLLPGDSKLAVPDAGGTVLIRSSPDRPTGTTAHTAFYGLANYNSNPTGFNQSVFICTPITADSLGNLYFGFVVTQNSPLGSLPSGAGGLAKVSALTGVGTWTTAVQMTGDSAMNKVVYNCAPALSHDGNTVYVAVNGGNFSYGYLVAVNSQTLASEAHVRLKDVRTPANDAELPDDGSATPTVGPDGDVYFGVLESNRANGNNDRGWLLHFSADLSTPKTPGAFGWDDTASIVPAGLVPSYTGTSPYLIMTKYNDYADFGLTVNNLAVGDNRLAVLDPNDTESYIPAYNPGGTKPAAVNVMKEILTVKGKTANPSLPGVREWCINSAAIDTVNKCAVVNSEDGYAYRWDFTTNTLSTGVKLAQATGEAYTPTVIGPDGASYAINRAVLNCCVQAVPAGIAPRVGVPLLGPTRMPKLPPRRRL